ncbi:MAG: GldG family protein [Ruminococcus sp.]|nr:GldG family protein [Ruminococcus sp.]
MQKKKHNFSGTLAFVISLLVLVIFIPINLIVSYYDKVYDLTPSGKYTLNSRTVQLLDSTADKHIDIYYLSELRYLQDAPEFLPLYHTLTELDARDNITLTCFDPNEDTNLANELNPTGIFNISTADVFVRCGDVIKYINHDKLFQTNSEGLAEYAGEEMIAGAIQICTSGTLPTIYFLTGHGEKSINDAYSVYAQTLKANNYDVQELDLSTVDRVPDNACILYLAGPTQDISDAERAKLSDYIDNGGAMAMLLAPCETEGRFNNIEYLLAKFELGMDYNIVTESYSGNQFHNSNDEQVPNFFRVEFTPFNSEFTQDLTTDINYMIDQGAYIPGISNTRSLYMLSTDTEAIEKSEIIENVQNSLTGEYTTVSTAMGGDSETVAANSELSGINLDFGYYSYNKITGAKLIAIGSADIINSDLEDENRVSLYVSGSQYLTIFSNTWLYDGDVEMGIGNKVTSYDHMDFENAKDAESVLAIIIIVPIAVALIGVAVWLKRRYA